MPWFTEVLSPPAEPEPEPEAAAEAPVRRRGGGGGGGSKKRNPSMGAQFKKQVVHLMATLNATQPHFIRCLKPNEEKKADVWDEKRMTEQVVFNGIPENIKIAQGGFVWRVEFGPFIGRYKMLSPRTWPAVAEGVLESTACRMICEDSELPEGKWVVGQKSKVFIKEHSVVEMLETLRNDRLGEMVIAISKNWKMRAARNHYRRLRKGAGLLSKMYKAKYAKSHFARVKRAAARLQAQSRGHLQRRRFARLVQEAAAAKVLTTYAQGWTARRKVRGLHPNPCAPWPTL